MASSLSRRPLKGLRSATITMTIILLLAATDASSAALFGTAGQDTAREATAALAEIADHSIKQFFSGLNGAADDAANKVTNERKAAILQAGNELNVAIANAAANFGSELGNRVDQASAELRPVLQELEIWRLQLEKVGDRTIELEDDFAVDLSRLPLGKEYFGIRHFSGTTLIENDKPVYPILISGDFLGDQSADRKVSVAASLNGRDLHDIVSLGENRIQINIANDIIHELFNDKAIKDAKLHIIATLTHPTCIFNCGDKTFEADINLVLMPDHIGDITFTVEQPVLDWRLERTVASTQAIDHTTSFDLGRLTGSLGPFPVLGDEKYGSPATAQCTEALLPAWRLPNGTVLFEHDPLLTSGWTSPSYTSPAAPGPDAERYDGMVVKELGFNPLFYHNSRCNGGVHCHMDPVEIKSHAERINSQSPQCNKLHQAESNYSARDTELVVSISGTADYQATWTVSAPVMVYDQVGTKVAESKTQPVYVSKFNELRFDTATHPFISFEFNTLGGAVKSGFYPKIMPLGLLMEEVGAVGTETIIGYKFVPTVPTD